MKTVPVRLAAMAGEEDPHKSFVEEHQDPCVHDARAHCARDALRVHAGGLLDVALAALLQGVQLTYEWQMHHAASYCNCDARSGSVAFA